MTNPVYRRRILMLLQESDTSFNLMLDAGGHPNIDYAAYTAETRIHCFRSALQNPDLSRLELASMLRKAGRTQESRKARNTYWTAFMAHYLSKNANMNAHH